MYEHKISFDLACGVHLTREVLAGKWKVSLLYHIAQGIRRPGELQKKLRLATRRVVHMQLNQLEAHELIGKNIFAETPPHVEYYLTPLGETLLPVITALGQWGEAHRGQLERVLAFTRPTAPATTPPLAA
jgi:DNA-binding HxlR family transcriptional regulator